MPKFENEDAMFPQPIFSADNAEDVTEARRRFALYHDATALLDTLAANAREMHDYAVTPEDHHRLDAIQEGFRRLKATITKTPVPTELVVSAIMLGSEYGKMLGVLGYGDHVLRGKKDQKAKEKTAAAKRAAKEKLYADIRACYATRQTSFPDADDKAHYASIMREFSIERDTVLRALGRKT